MEECWGLWFFGKLGDGWTFDTKFPLIRRLLSMHVLSKYALNDATPKHPCYIFFFFVYTFYIKRLALQLPLT